MPRFSVVIPAYNEAALLPRLLDSLERARERYAVPDAVEIIVADNQSTDATAAIAAARGCRVATIDKRVIAAARNGGAALAQGEILAFIDADSSVHPQTFAAIDQALASGRCVAGATGVTMERWSAGIALTYACMLPSIWLTGMDTGVVFCRRADFAAVGGYDESRLLAEDVMFLLSLRRLGRGRGQKLVRARGAKAITSTRKFDEFGDWHFFGLMWQGLRHQLKGDLGSFADRYWYKPRR